MKLKGLLYATIIFLALIMAGCCLEFKQFLGVENGYYEYRDAAESAERVQLYGLAEKNYLNAQADAMRKGEYIYNEYSTLARIYEKQGRFDDALGVLKKYLEPKNENLRLTQKILNYGYMGDLYMMKGQYTLALQSYEMSLKIAEEQKQLEPHNTGPSQWLMFNYYFERGEYEKAEQAQQEKLDTMIERGAIGYQKARQKNTLAMAYYYSGDIQTAEKLFREASGLNANAAVPFVDDRARSLTMLGHIAEHQGENAQALKYYKDALQLLREDAWPEAKATKDHPAFEWKVEEADVLSQIARFQLKQGHMEEATQAYHEAQRLRLASQTQAHPNYADLLLGLAGVVLCKGEMTSATLLATQSLQILDTALVPTHPRIAPTLMALSSIHILAGEPDQAPPLDARLETILQKPLGPWKEDFMETAAFYARLLTKAGKTDAAKHIEQLQARQKDRR